jgi:methionyl aminopeptidase
LAEEPGVGAPGGSEEMAACKTDEQLVKMRKAGRVVAEMHEKTRAAIKPGVTTAQLDRIARGVIDKRGAQSNFLGYHGFPAVICASPNNVIVHGIPGRYRLAEGDIISIDCGAIVDGWHGDAAYTAPVGSVSDDVAKLVEVTEASLRAGIDQMVEGNRLGDIGHAVQATVEDAGFSVVREYVGHAIGTAMHEKPEVPNFGRPGKGIRLRAGNVFAVEPMVNLGGPGTRVLEDGWSVVTADGSLSAHFEHTIAITDDGPEVLTRA